MSKFRIVNLIDKLFISVCVFLIIYAWINFYIRDLWTTFFLSLLFSAAILFLFFYFTGKKQNKMSLSRKEFEEIEKNFLLFRLIPKKERLELLKQILEKEHTVTLKNNMLTYVKDEKKHLMIIATNIPRISDYDIINLVDEMCDVQIDVIDIICNDFDKTAMRKIFIDKEINLISKNSLYSDYFKKYEIYPDPTNINTKVQKIRFIDILKNMFTPNRAKSYFFCGFILLFSSIILPYFVYYIVMGSVLISFAIICKLIPKFQKQ